MEEVEARFIARARELASGCDRVFAAVSGGVDSTVVVAIGPNKVVGLYRNIRSNPVHHSDVLDLQKVLGFDLIDIEANGIYDEGIRLIKEKIVAAGLPWYEEGDPAAEGSGFPGAYASFKSRLTTPLAGFIAKIVDKGAGRIFGTGNAEEDGLVYYFDKYGDGAVDNNILNGLTKMEVRQFALYYAKVYAFRLLGTKTFTRIANKLPSADLMACGDAHNDESELTSWAKAKGYNIQISYGDCEHEGNLAWALKQNFAHGIITGSAWSWDADRLKFRLGYTDEQIALVMFLREIEKANRHKVNPNMPGLPRPVLKQEGYVD
jgi:NH3-dependent NAD+ synthetase